MQGKLFIIRPEHVEIAHVERRELVKVPELNELRTLCAGDITAVPYFHACRHLLGDASPCYAFANEGGPHISLPLNRLATRLWHGVAPQMGSDQLAGTVILLAGDSGFMSSL